MSDKAKSSASVEPLRKPVPCPECKQPSSRDYYPFCTKRCSDADLGNWLTGTYAIPVEEEDQGISSDQLREL